ncbi:response regulator transcription factor [Rhodoblastus acidophilus]|uniref:Response regulator transcription factor n=1 Tax=Candidatus Rhodoblastus alkanivorans TaxID=2954117 RepID=A0ABS9Z7A8_9HYPH|nr:response regulator transcription factor [Candidatus Rhodoblastus alkanivorans]MCI4679564.1 response regulator transcription factor [Candidatus Rhodoblastus alkanivorans]MCI4683315.1 response regulator transcription factor [Candidatus Rhodoblastus alkanivorans]MDI4640628.1 response regulator transcription factor [Rhodoblastus acidophilus]
MRPDERIRILIAEDQPMIRRAFASMLALEADFEIVAQAADGVEAVQAARRYLPDVVLLDIQMPRLNGIAATRQILCDCPEAQVIILTTYDTDDLIFDSICAGAQAYLLKDADENEILDTIRAVSRGQSRLAPNVARKLLDEFRRVRRAPNLADGIAPEEPLTDRENAILQLIVAGKGNREIATQLRLAEGTVKNYVSRILEKLNARSRTELAVKALNRRID